MLDSYNRRSSAFRRRSMAAHRVAGALAVSLMALVALSVSSAAHAEDLAICAGVNRYPNLRPGANLNGCVNDAKLFAQKLQELGFHDPIVLDDTKATKAGILGAIASLRSRLHSGDRVVIYFAGHGTLSSSGDSDILPSDALDGSEANDIQIKELYNAVKSLGGDDIEKTVILDSCHSGGMVRGIPGLRGFHHLRPRFYVRTAELNKPAMGNRDVKRWEETDANGGDDMSKVVQDKNAGSGGICYFTAAQKNEVANETEVGGQEHGLFTYYLVGALKGNGATWKEVSADVSGKVAGDTDYEQKPQVYPSNVMNKAVFGGAVSAEEKPLGLDAIYNLSNPIPSIVTIKRYLKGPNPELAPIPVGSNNYFEIKVGQDGYLVVIGRDPTNALDIVFPKTPTTDAMRVHAGDVIRIPGNPAHFMVPDTAGSDGVKAILFDSAQQAQDMLQPFKDADASGYKTLTVASADRAWREVGDDTKAAPNTKDISFYTSEITTQIVPAM